MIYCTLGTMFMDFGRLIRGMDEIARDTGERIVVQRGLATTLPKYCEHFDFKPREEHLALQQEARVLVMHAGIGAVMDALQSKKPFLVVPRRKQFGEHMNDHQLDLAEMVARRGWGKAILDVGELPQACANPLPSPLSYRPDRDRLIATLGSIIDGIAQHRD